jgi:site-specific DNA-cytosine methylase
MKILIACEESQTVCKAFRKLGHEAYSCDILPCSGGHPEWHIQGDLLKVLDEDWDMIIAHPPCTYLTVTGNRWFKDEYKDRFPTRKQDREDAVIFFKKIANNKCPKICIENPLGIMSTRLRKPEQIIQPYQFGHVEAKKTCLWLKGLPDLIHTKLVEPQYTTFKSGKRMGTWYVNAAKLTPAERQKARSKTFQGIADAMADQWGK